MTCRSGDPPITRNARRRQLPDRLRVGVTRDTRDSYLRPTEGSILDVSFEEVRGLFPRRADHSQFSPGQRRLQQVLDDVRAGGQQRPARAGLSTGRWPGRPRTRRCSSATYAGGFRSMRGFEFRGVGPAESMASRSAATSWCSTAWSTRSRCWPTTTSTSSPSCDTGTVETRMEIKDYRVVGRLRRSLRGADARPGADRPGLRLPDRQGPRTTTNRSSASGWASSTELRADQDWHEIELVRTDSVKRPAVVKVERAVRRIDDAGPKLAVVADLIELPDLIAVDSRRRVEQIRLAPHRPVGLQFLGGRQQLRRWRLPHSRPLSAFAGAPLPAEPACPRRPAWGTQCPARKGEVQRRRSRERSQTWRCSF